MPADTGRGWRPPAPPLGQDIPRESSGHTLLPYSYSQFGWAVLFLQVCSIQGAPSRSPHCGYPAPLSLRSEGWPQGHVHHTVNMSPHQGPEMQPRQSRGSSQSQLPDHTLLVPNGRGKASSLGHWEGERDSSSDAHPWTGWVTCQGICPWFHPNFYFPGSMYQGRGVGSKEHKLQFAVTSMTLPIPQCRKASPEPPATHVQNTHSSPLCLKGSVNAWENNRPGAHILFALTHVGFGQAWKPHFLSFWNSCQEGGTGRQYQGVRSQESLAFMSQKVKT